MCVLEERRNNRLCRTPCENKKQCKSAELQKADNTCSRLLFVISGQNMFGLLKLNDTSEASLKVLKVYAGKERLDLRRYCKLGGVGACSPRTFSNLGAQKCHFLRFPHDIFSK